VAPTAPVLVAAARAGRTVRGGLSLDRPAPGRRPANGPGVGGERPRSSPSRSMTPPG